MLGKSLHSLYRYIQREEYGGWDLFDGLNSRIFRGFAFYQSELLRLAWIQLFKRSPINFRRIALVPKSYNSKGLWLFASGLISLGKFDEAKRLLDRLEGMICSGYSGVSWGYNFDWQARAFYVPVGKPNMVTTVFAANAFLDYLNADSSNYINEEIRREYYKIIEGVCEFILYELVVFEDGDRLCFGYIPGEEARVHNANMIGAALLGRVHSIDNNKELLDKSRKAMRFSIDALKNGINRDRSRLFSDSSLSLSFFRSVH